MDPDAFAPAPTKGGPADPGRAGVRPVRASRRGAALRPALKAARGPLSTMVTTNLSFGEWVQVFGDEKLTTALLDRLGHHAHVLTTSGSSYRTRKRKDKSEEEQPMEA